MKRLWLSSFLYVFISLLTACSTDWLSLEQQSIAGSPTVPPTSIAAIHQVTLLVPLQGPLGAGGQAIRNGFLAAYYQARQDDQPTPTINVVDTSGGNISSLYQQAVNNGADFVVGPLTKPEVQTLAHQGNLTVPTLALNTLDNNQRVANLYQFGLSPRDEALQAADKAWADGYRRVLILKAANTWGQTIANTFSQRWQALGGQVAGDVAFTPQQSMSNLVAQVLQISPSQQQALAKDHRFVPQPRQDVDMIFLVALPQQARQVVPFIKYYAGTQYPIYATSTVYSGTPTPNADQDLNGIVFCDMPWVLGDAAPLPGNLAALRSHLSNLWAGSFTRNPKLYALGVDAYNLIGRLNTLLTTQTSMAGATGTLTLGTERQVHRRLWWVRMRHGVPATL